MKKKFKFNEHHPIPTSRERNNRHENIEDTQDVIFKNLLDQPTTKMKMSEHDAMHNANMKRIDKTHIAPMTPREMMYRYLHINHKALSNKAKTKIIQLLQQWKDFYDEKYVK